MKYEEAVAICKEFFKDAAPDRSREEILIALVKVSKRHLEHRESIEGILGKSSGSVVINTEKDE